MPAAGLFIPKARPFLDSVEIRSEGEEKRGIGPSSPPGPLLVVITPA